MTEQQYFEHLNAIANYLTAWGSQEQIINYLETTKESPRLGKAVSIPLDLGDKSSEWILDEWLGIFPNLLF